jgi:hypothetical protein
MITLQAMEQIMDLCSTLRMMGIPIDGPAWMFEGNQSNITSSTIPNPDLNKCHNALSFDRVHEAITACILYLTHIDGKLNLSDILPKLLAWAIFWPLIEPLLFPQGKKIKKTIHPNLQIPQAIESVVKSYDSIL